MAELNTEEEMYQLYTVMNDLAVPEPEEQENINETSEDCDKIMFVTTVPSDPHQSQDVMEEDPITFLEEPLVTEENTLSVCNFKFVTLSDGQVFLTTDTILEDNLTSIQPQLLTIPEETSTSDGLLDNLDLLENSISHEEEGEDKQEDYHSIKLMDGSTALIDANLLKLVKMKTNEVSPGVISPNVKQKSDFICTYVDCGKTFTSSHHLSVHTRIHTGWRPYACPVVSCSKKFITNYSLKSHVRTHTGEKPYGCAVCRKHFKAAGDLRKHIRIHTGDKPFKCPIAGCDKSFSTSNIRKVHVRSHTGERPYVCTVAGCEKAFSSATNYKNHIRIHSGEKPYSCSVEGCGSKFTEYSSLYKHRVVHIPMKSVQCNFDGCYQVFKSDALLKHHKRMMHNVFYISDIPSNYVLHKNEEEEDEDDELFDDEKYIVVN